MSWSLFFIVLGVTYFLYYAVVVGSDFLLSGREDGAFVEETKEISLSELYTNDSGEEEPENIFWDTRQDPINGGKNLSQSPAQQNKEEVNIQNKIMHQGLPIEEFVRKAKLKSASIY